MVIVLAARAEPRRWPMRSDDCFLTAARDVDAQPEPPPPTRDPEFGVVNSGLQSHEPDDLHPEAFLRVVANPFLGTFGLLLWLMALIWFGRLWQHNPQLISPLAPILAVLLLSSLWLVPSLFQFHCLDCGRSGRLANWRGHVCPASAVRRLAGRPRRLRGPSPFVQIILWFWGGLALALVATSMGFHLPQHW